MKIAFVSQPFDDSVPPIESGSIQIWTYQVILHLAKEHDITVYAVRKPGNGAFQEEGGIKYRRMSLFWDRWILRFMRLIKFWYRDPRKPHHASVLYYIGYMIQTALDIRRRGYDVVHIHNYSQFVLPIRFFNPRVKIVLHMQGEWLSQLDHGMIRHRLSKVQQILGCSDYLMDKVVDVIPEVKAKVRTLYNGVDTTKFVANGKYDHAEEDQIVRFLFVGRHSPEKGVHDLLRAMQLLRERTDRFHLTVVGPKYVVPSDMIVDISSDPKVRDLRRFYGEDPNNQETYLKALEDLRADGLEDFVTFAGSIPHSQLAELYRDCDVLTNPSLSETFGIALVEGMAAMMPVVATRVGGMPEIVVPEETGFVVESADPEALAEVYYRLVSEAALRRQMGTAGRRRAEAVFDWSIIAANLIDLYRQIPENA